MERFTQRAENGNVFYPHCFEECQGVAETEKCISCDYYDRLLKRFADYEDAEEQGLLLRLPIGIGQPYYVVERCKCGKHYKCNNKKANARKRAIIVEPWKEDLTLRYCLKVFERPFKVDYLKNIGKTVFLTKEEAEQALAEMKGV